MTPHIYTTDMNIRENSSASQQNKLFKHLMIERVTQQYGQQRERTDLQVLGQSARSKKKADKRR